MGTENNPVIEVTWFDDPDWRNITDYLKTFKVRDAGVLKVSQAEITLQNRYGRFSSGVEKISPMSLVNIRGDVRGVWDNIFLGRFYNFKGDYSRRKHGVKIVCRGHGQQFLMDTKTRDYGIEDETGVQFWTLKQVIENFLVYSDSNYPTGFTLETDTGDITTKHAGEECNFEHDYLLDCLRKIAERLNYDGYIKLVNSTPTLEFTEVGKKPDGTPNYADPPVTLTHPFVFARPEFNIDDIYNYILVKGGVEEGIPRFKDEWTEEAIARFEPDIWIGETENDVVSDHGKVEPKMEPWPRINDYCIKVSNSVGYAGAYLDIANTAESPYIDCRGKAIADDTYGAKRFKTLDLWFCIFPFLAMAALRQIDIEDDASPTPNRLRFNPRNLAAVWEILNLPLGEDVPIALNAVLGYFNQQWYRVVGTTFTWKITKVHVQLTGQRDLYIDGFFFNGARMIDPLLYPSWHPPVIDQDSIDAYGRRVLWYEDEEIGTKNDAQLIGATIRDIRKNPHQRIVCKKGAKIWVKPHQVVTLNIPQYEINGEEWRPIEIETSFKSPKLLRTTFTLVPKLFKVSTKAYLEDELAGLIGK